jgi:hypothetical protein
LSWINPVDTDYAGIVVQRKLGGYPENAGDGDRIYNGPNTACTDLGLLPKTTYFYAAFTYNSLGYYSSSTLSSRAYATTHEALRYMAIMSRPSS